MIRLAGLITATAIAIAGSGAFAQNASAPADDGSAAAHAVASPSTHLAPGTASAGTEAVDASAITCAEFVRSSSKDRSGVVATLSDQARRARQPDSVKSNPMPGSHFAPVSGGGVLDACKAHPELRVAEVVESEVATSR